jgi:hypothetical protein
MANPDKVSCLYAANPVMRSNTSKLKLVENLGPLAKAGVPLLHVCGALDPGLEENTRVVEQRYKDAGGSIRVIVQAGRGHYPLEPEDPAPVVDFITQSVK